MYFNYHAKAMRLIREGHCTHFELVERWNQIAPAMVLYFDNEPPMPIREERWADYFELIDVLCVLSKTSTWPISQSSLPK